VTIESSIKVSASHQKQENKSVPFYFFLFCVFPDSVYRFFGGASTFAYSLIRRLNFSFGDNQIKLFSFVILWVIAQVAKEVTYQLLALFTSVLPADSGINLCPID
jgi:hypothetical protein